MREIKFRAWDSNMNRHSSSGRMTYFTLSDALDGKMYDDRYGTDIDEDHFVMQYTGLKDKNDIEIYDGDILVIHHGERKYIVSWYADDAAWRIKTEGNGWQLGDIGISGLAGINHCSKVIGNIYENPELIK